MRLAELAKTIDAELVSEIEGAGDIDIRACGRIEDAKGDEVSFLANQKYASQLAETNAAAVIVAKDVECKGQTLLRAADPYYAFRNAVIALHGERQHPQPADADASGHSRQAAIDPTAIIGQGTVIHPFAVVSRGAKIGKNCVLYPNTFVGPDVTIGDDCLLFPNVVVYDHCVLGNRVTLHAGTVIGQDGFGYATHQGAHHKITQAGNAVIENDVEMGANCSIDRATLGSTIIGTGTKFSDGVTIGHGAKVGKHNLFVALVGLAGSVETGDYVVLGGQVGVAGHLKIGNMVQVAATSGVMNDIPDGEKWGGSPAIPLNEAKRIHLSSIRLPDLIGRVKKLERELKAMRPSE